MSEHDERLISGAVITAEMWFELELASATVFGRDEAPEPGCFCLRYRVSPLVDVALEGPVKALSQLSGTLAVSNQRERTQRLGRFSREDDGYRIDINLFEAELDRFLKLVGLGLRPRMLKLEFDIEVPQWFELGQYWDDVRYPRVDIHEHWIEWSPAQTGGPSGNA
ncbi:hypothetical protein [Caulobacter sp. 17J65-9]|uniref:hypothetical protein n=1 Tax=Caulobacter sp. 17J65-9 TaxID=2709382 RepID=UPI0013C89902|nr:hypothetical protein [Caulobacter sp. 17J65-9]NEX93811.1 hypothetical protein [Caulobacter sp. 17J65-9]